MQRTFNRLDSAAPPRLRREWDSAVPVFEERLALDSRWALAEGSTFFEGQGAVQETLRKIAARLRELEIPYAVVGGMALFNHGLGRFTEDVDILVTIDGLKKIHDRLEGLGYLPPFNHSKNLRDTATGVKIKFLVTGGYPGDGRPKPVVFPDPSAVAMENDGVYYVNLPTLVELKIASGMTNTERMKDLSDALELIKILGLTRDFTDKLNPFVREKYLELWIATRPAQKRYLKIWPNKVAAQDANTLQAMLADGVLKDLDKATADDCTWFFTTDPIVAKKYDMHDESEFWDEPDEERTESPVN